MNEQRKEYKVVWYFLFMICRVSYPDQNPVFFFGGSGPDPVSAPGLRSLVQKVLSKLFNRKNNRNIHRWKIFMTDWSGSGIWVRSRKNHGSGSGLWSGRICEVGFG